MQIDLPPDLPGAQSTEVTFAVCSYLLRLPAYHTLPPGRDDSESFTRVHPANFPYHQVMTLEYVLAYLFMRDVRLISLAAVSCILTGIWTNVSFFLLYRLTVFTGVAQIAGLCRNLRTPQSGCGRQV